MQTADIEPTWLNYAYAERLTGLSRVTLWRLHNAGEIKIARVGRTVRINHRSLEDYLERAAEDAWKQQH